MASTPPDQVRKDSWYWPKRLAVSAPRTYSTCTRLPVTPSPSQTIPPAAAAVAVASGISAGTPAAATEPVTSLSLGAAAVSFAGTCGSGAAGATGGTSRSTTSPGGGASGPCEHVPASLTRYPPTHGWPFFAGVRPA